MYVVMGTGDRESGSLEWATRAFWDPLAAQRYARAVRKHPEVDQERPEGLVGKGRYWVCSVVFGYEEELNLHPEGIYLVWCREEGVNGLRYDCPVCWYGREVQAKMHCIWANAWVRENFKYPYSENPYDPSWIGPPVGVPRYEFEEIQMGRE